MEGTRNPLILFGISLLVAVVAIAADGVKGGERLAPLRPEEVAEQIRKDIAKAEPGQYLLLLRDCIVHAQELKASPEENPHYKVLLWCMGEEQPAELRTAVVSAITVPARGREPYLDGARLLLKYLGGRPTGFRKALREGLAPIVLVAPAHFVSDLKAILAGLGATRSQVEDAAYVLWEVAPRDAVESLLTGLRARADAQRDVAAHRWILADYLHRREASVEAWEAYWRENPDHPALRETQLLRRRVEEELSILWTAAADGLSRLPGSDAGVEAYSALTRVGLESQWASVRANACREVGVLAQRYATATAAPQIKNQLRRLLGSLLQLLGAQILEAAKPEIPPPKPEIRYEPLAVRLEALRAVAAFRSVVSAEEESKIVQLLGDVVAASAEEQEYRVEALRIAGDLGLGQLRDEVSSIVLHSGEARLDLAVQTEAVRALGKIGVSEPGNPDVEIQRRVIGAIFSLYERVAPLAAREAGAFRQAAVSTLGRIGGGAAADDVKKFLRAVLRANLDKEEGRSLAFDTVCALGQLGGAETIGDLTSILSMRENYPSNLVLAAVDAIWLIGKSGQAALVAKVFAEYLETSDAELSKAVARNVLNLVSGSITVCAEFAQTLKDAGKLRAASEILTNPDVRKVRQLALVEGSPVDFERCWVVEDAILEAFEGLERFDDCTSEIDRLRKFIAELKRGPEFDAVALRESAKLERRYQRVKAMKELVASIDRGDEEAASAAFKALVQIDGGRAAWASGRLLKSKISGRVTEALLMDPDLPETVKALLNPEKKESGPSHPPGPPR